MLSKVKSVFNSTLGNETIDKAEIPKQTQKKQKPTKKTKTDGWKIFKKQEKEIQNIPAQEQNPSYKEFFQNQEPASYSVNLNEHPVLGILNIPAQPDLSGIMSSEDVDNIEFTLSAPTGLNPNEVEMFCNSVSTAIFRYRSIIEERQRHFEKLLEEVDKLGQKLIEKQSENELSHFISHEKDQESRLKDEIIDLRLQNEELKDKLKKLNIARDKKMTEEQSLPVSFLQENKKTEENKDDTFNKLLSEF